MVTKSARFSLNIKLLKKNTKIILLQDELSDGGLEISKVNLPKIIDFAKSVRRGSDENKDYGNLYILNEYAGVPFGVPIIGRLQHGWMPDLEYELEYKNNLLNTYVWTEESEQGARNKGWKNFYAIGAPWLYLLENLRSVGAISHDIENTQKKQFQELWVYGHHSVKNDDGREYNLLGFLEDAIRSPEASKLVLLAPVDFNKLNEISPTTFKKIPIMTLGNRRNSSTANAHLYNLLYLLSSVNTVVIDYPSTLILYAGTLGNAIRWNKNASFEFGYNQISEIKNQTLLSFMQHEKLPQIEFSKYALKTLGQSSLRKPNELRNLFHWNTNGMVFRKHLDESIRILAKSPLRWMRNSH